MFDQLPKPAFLSLLEGATQSLIDILTRASFYLDEVSLVDFIDQVLMPIDTYLLGVWVRAHLLIVLVLIIMPLIR